MTEPFRGQVGHPDGLTFDRCRREGVKLTGTCGAHGERLLVPDHDKHRAWWTRRLPLLLNDGHLVCAVCRQPFASLRAESWGGVHGAGLVLRVWQRK